MIDISEFYDSSKKGTVIISTYRSGTHFIIDGLFLYLRSRGIPVSKLGELNTPDIPETRGYNISIINAVVPKITLVKQQESLKEYHVVKLTRNDKISHWISYYVWRQFNTEQQRFDDSNLPHHGGDKSKYSQLPKLSCPLHDVENWMMEQFIVNLFKANVTIDYTDLPSINSDIKWAPNDYNKTLDQLFSNSVELEQLLKEYKVPNV